MYAACFAKCMSYRDVKFGVRDAVMIFLCYSPKSSCCFLWLIVVMLVLRFRRWLNYSAVSVENNSSFCR